MDVAATNVPKYFRCNTRGCGHFGSHFCMTCEVECCDSCAQEHFAMQRLDPEHYVFRISNRRIEPTVIEGETLIFYNDNARKPLPEHGRDAEQRRIPAPLTPAVSATSIRNQAVSACPSCNDVINAGERLDSCERCQCKMHARCGVLYTPDQLDLTMVLCRTCKPHAASFMADAMQPPAKKRHMASATSSDRRSLLPGICLFS